MQLPKRKINRLQCYDYSENGAYFITICTKNNEHLFGTIETTTRDALLGKILPDRPVIQLTEIGEIVNHYISKIPDKYSHVFIDKHVVMPNHVHMIIMIDKADWCIDVEALASQLETQPQTVGAVIDRPSAYIPNMQIYSRRSMTAPTNAPTISTIIRHFKGFVTREVGESVWQKSFYDHIIRDERDYENICNYIEYNPDKWQEDKYFTKS